MVNSVGGWVCRFFSSKNPSFVLQIGSHKNFHGYFSIYDARVLIINAHICLIYNAFVLHMLTKIALKNENSFMNSQMQWIRQGETRILGPIKIKLINNSFQCSTGNIKYTYEQQIFLRHTARFENIGIVFRAKNASGKATDFTQENGSFNNDHNEQKKTFFRVVWRYSNEQYSN